MIVALACLGCLRLHTTMQRYNRSAMRFIFRRKRLFGGWTPAWGAITTFKVNV